MLPTPTASNKNAPPKNRFMGSPTYRHNLHEAVRKHKEDYHLSSQYYVADSSIEKTDYDYTIEPGDLPRTVKKEEKEQTS